MTTDHNMQTHTERLRMNDYVGGPGIFADVTWHARCTDERGHTLGRLSYCCVRCGHRPTINYRDANDALSFDEGAECENAAEELGETWTQDELDALKVQAEDRAKRFGWST